MPEEFTVENSILDDVKKIGGIEANYPQFDKDIIMHINTVFAILYQMGASETPIIITSRNNTWDELLGSRTDLELIKTYVALRVRMMFDPPTSTPITTALKETIDELGWRISVSVDPKNSII